MTLNQRIATRITNAIGSMWCAYAFTVLAIISLPAALATGSPIVIVAWIAQTFLQLVLLPIIMVGQQLQANQTSQLTDQISKHHAMMKEHHKMMREHIFGTNA